MRRHRPWRRRGPFFSLANTDFVVLLAFLLFIAVLVYFKVPGLVWAACSTSAPTISSPNWTRRASPARRGQALLASYERKQKEVQAQADRIVEQARAEAKRSRRAGQGRTSAPRSRRIAGGRGTDCQRRGVGRQVRPRPGDHGGDGNCAGRDRRSDMTAAKRNALIDESIATVGKRSCIDDLARASDHRSGLRTPRRLLARGRFYWAARSRRASIPFMASRWRAIRSLRTRRWRAPTASFPRNPDVRDHGAPAASGSRACSASLIARCWPEGPRGVALLEHRLAVVEHALRSRSNIDRIMCSMMTLWLASMMDRWNSASSRASSAGSRAVMGRLHPAVERVDHGEVGVGAMRAARSAASPSMSRRNDR